MIMMNCKILKHVANIKNHILPDDYSNLFLTLDKRENLISMFISGVSVRSLARRDS